MKRREQGVSLVELMVGIAIGLMVVATATLLLGHQLHDAGRLRAETALEQDLRAAADLVARELRRVGERPAATGGGADINAGDEAAPSDSVTYLHVEDDSSTQPSGVKLDGGVLKLLLGGSGWQAITDPEVMKVKAFRVAVVRHLVALDGYCARPCPPSPATPCPPQQEVREARVSLTGTSTRDPQVQRSLESTVRLRNDRIVGHCGA